MMAERLEGWAAESAKSKITEESKAGAVSEARQQAIYRDEIQKVAQITKVAVAAGAALTGLDVMAASNAAEAALENNFQATHDELPSEEEEGPFSPRLKRTKLARHKKKYIDPLVEYGREKLKEEVLDPIAQSSAGQAAAPYLTMAKNEAGKAVNSFLDQPAAMPMLGLAATLSGKDLPKLPGQEHLWTTRDMLKGASLAFEGLASGTRKTLRFFGAKPETAQDTTDALGTAVSFVPVSKIAAVPKTLNTLAKGAKTATPVKSVPKLDLSKTAAVANKNELPALKEKVSKPKGSNNPTTNEARKYGQERHKQFTLDNMKLKSAEPYSGLTPDLLTPSIVHELKPGSVSGVRKGLVQLEAYIEHYDRPGLLHLYQPKNKLIDLDNIVKKNFKKDSIVIKVQENLKKNAE